MSDAKPIPDQPVFEKFWYTPKEAAAMLSISLSQLQYRMRLGELNYRKNGRNTMIKKRELEKYAKRDHMPIGKWRPGE